MVNRDSEWFGGVHTWGIPRNGWWNAWEISMDWRDFFSWKKKAHKKWENPWFPVEISFFSWLWRWFWLYGAGYCPRSWCFSDQANLLGEKSLDVLSGFIKRQVGLKDIREWENGGPGKIWGTDFRKAWPPTKNLRNIMKNHPRVASLMVY